jgi:hypothetical protein
MKIGITVAHLSIAQWLFLKMSISKEVSYATLNIFFSEVKRIFPAHFEIWVEEKVREAIV